jgi:hypothetical protein
VKLEPDDVVIIVKPDGRVVYWAQDTPEVLAYLERVEALSTCDCADDRCPADAMLGWRQQMLEGRIDA